MGDSVDDEIAAAQQSRGVGLTSVSADDEFYGGSSRAGLATSIAAGGEAEEDEGVEAPRKRQTFTAPQHLLNDIPLQEAEDPAAKGKNSDRIADREDEYHARRQRVLSPARADAFALGDKTPDVSQRSYKEVMQERELARQREEIRQKLKEQAEEAAAGGGGGAAAAAAAEPKKRRRWDQPSQPEKRANTRWDDMATPGPAAGSKWDATPTPGRGRRRAAPSGTRRRRRGAPSTRQSGTRRRRPAASPIPPSGTTPT